MAEKKIAAGKEAGITTKLSNIGYLTKNILRPIRLVADVMGISPGGAQRIVMAGSMASARITGAMKEARLANEEILEKSRIDDIDKATEEAWKIYERAKKKAGNNGSISALELKTAYLHEIPKDLQERLKNTTVANGMVQKVLRKHLDFDINRLNKDIEKIEKSGKLSPEKIEAKKEQLLRRWEKKLTDYDRVLTQTGTVDGFAMAARYAEATSKNIVRMVTVQTLYLTLDKVWDGISHIFSSQDIPDSGATSPIPAIKPQHAPGSTSSLTQTEPLPEPTQKLADVMKNSPGVSEPLPEPTKTLADVMKDARGTLSENVEGIPKEAIIGKGEGIEHALKRQIIASPELAEKLGFEKGMDINKFASGAAHRVALGHGYVDKFTGEEIRVRGGAGEVAYQMQMDENGEIKIQEFKMKDGKFTPSDDLHAKDSHFEGDEKEDYEYRWKKVPAQTSSDVTEKAPASTPAETTTPTVAESIAPKPPEAPAHAPTPEPVPEKVPPVEPAPTPAPTQTPEEIVRADLAKHYEAADNANTIRTGTEMRTGTGPTETIYSDGRPVERPAGHNVFYDSQRGTWPQQNVVEGYFFPDLTQKENTILNNILQTHSEFAGNPYNLSGKQLLAVYEINRENIFHVIPTNTETAWGEISALSAKDTLSADFTNPDGSPNQFINYLQKLRAISGVEPKGRIPFLREAEDNEHYIARALQRIVKLGKTAELKASI
jgi:hypothetical protein